MRDIYLNIFLTPLFLSIFSTVCLADALVQQGEAGKSLGSFSSGSYQALGLNGNSTTRACGGPDGIPVPGNYLRGETGELAVWNPSFGLWNICGADETTAIAWGAPGDKPVAADYDGDGLTDLGVFRPTTGEWLITFNPEGDSAGGVSTITLGGIGDIPIPFDRNGDGITDVAIYRANAETGISQFVVLVGTTKETIDFGVFGDVPVPADYDGDGKEDIATWRPSDGVWYLSLDKKLVVKQFGLAGDIPSPIDFDGDGTADFVVFRPGSSQWFVMTQAGAFQQSTLGRVGSRVANHSRATLIDRVVARDFNGDRFSDLAVARIGDGGVAQFLFGSTSFIPHARPTDTFGRSGDIFVPGDYDGDGVTDIAVVRAVSGNAVWAIRLSSRLSVTTEPLIVTYGIVGDQLIPADYNGDGKTNLAVIRNIPEGFKLWLPASSGGDAIEPVLWGLSDDLARTADVDGDGRSDFIVVRRTPEGELLWFIRLATGEALEPKLFGFATDEIVIADNNGDGKAQIGVIRAANGFKLVIFEGDEPYLWGLEGDVSVDGIYGLTKHVNRVVWRVLNGQGTFFIRNSNNTASVVPFGVPGDIPLRGTRPTLLGASSSGTGSSSGGSSSGNNPGCVASAGTAGDFLDGARSGALWKPVSEGVGNAASVILLPSSYNGATITILGSAGEVVSGIQRTDCCSKNGGRAHFWASKRASKMASSKPLTVKIEKGGVTECRSVPDPTKRYD